MSRQVISTVFKVIVLLACAVGVAYLFFLQRYTYAALLFLVTVAVLYYILSNQHVLYKYLIEFSEAAKYSDFTRRYPIKNPRSAEGKLFTAFNQVNQTYKSISADKEVQNQYLNKVINMLDSAIIFYNHDTGKVIWINDAFKQLFHTPHLGNIKGMQKRHEELYEKTMALDVGQQQMDVINSSKGKIKLLIQTSEFGTKDGLFRIIVYQNINEAMDATETRAWHKLLRVLTHEIMNSIAPITSLAETLYGKLDLLEGHEEIEDVKLGIYTIKRRSEGLLQFAKSYRLINKVDQPEYTDIVVVQLFENIYQLLEPTLIQKKIDLDIIIKNTRLILQADVNLIEQVLINIVLNAIEAVKEVENPYISLSALENEGNIQLKVADNGIGMSADIQDQIFTPFFTTKKSGSGIGLTLSKQIMLLHKGNIFVDSDEGKGSVFVLQF